MVQKNSRIIFYSFLKMGKVILCCFSWSALLFVFWVSVLLRHQKNPSLTETVLWHLSMLRKLPPAPQFSAVLAGMGRTPCAIICKWLQSVYPHKRGSSFPSQGSAVHADWHPGCLGLLRTAQSTPRSPVPWISYVHLVVSLLCTSKSAEPVGIALKDKMALREPNIMFLALLPFGGNPESELPKIRVLSWMHGMYLNRSPRRAVTIKRRGQLGAQAFSLDLSVRQGVGMS